MTTFELSPTAVDVLARGLGVDCRVFPFTLPAHGREPGERARAVHAVSTDLHRRGLAGGGDLAPAVEWAVRLLGEDRAIAVLGSGALRARAASAGGRACVAVQTSGGAVRFTLVRPAELIRSVVGLLPRLGAGSGRSVTVARPADPARGPVRPVRPRRDPALHGVEEIMRARTGEGCFLVTGAEPRGVTWLDTRAGRYALWSAGGHTTCVPADAARLAGKLAELTR